MLLAGRILFATAIVGFGLLCLVYVDFIHQLQPVDVLLPASTLAYSALAILIGVVLVAAGGAILMDVWTYRAGLLLAAMFALGIVVLQVPSAFMNPELLRSPWWVRTFEELALAGAAVILAGMASRPVRERWVRTGRVLFGVSLPVFGILHFIYAENVASLVPSFYPAPLFLAYLTGAAKVAAGAAIATGVLSRLAATMVAVLYGTYALTLHIPRQFMDRPEGYRPGATSMFIAVGFCGAALLVAGSLAKRHQTAAVVESQPVQVGTG